MFGKPVSQRHAMLIQQDIFFIKPQKGGEILPSFIVHFYLVKQLFQVLQVIRRLLINVVIEPVCIEQRRMPAPVH